MVSGFWLMKLKHRWRRKLQYLRLRLRVFLIRLVVIWPRLRQLLVQDPVLTSIKTEYLHHLWDVEVLCLVCSEALGRRQVYPLGDFNMTALVAPEGQAQTVTLICPVCNCTVSKPPYENVRFFNFRLGDFTSEL